MSTASYWLKVQRAEQHLAELRSVLSHSTADHPYPVRETLKTNGKDRTVEYRLDIGVRPSDWIPILAGDFLFNIRSALDHLAVALAPRSRRSKASFPIFLADIDERDPVTGSYVHRDERARWETLTKGLHPDALAILKRLQPYKATRHAPDDHLLSILSRLQNADKHRHLVAITTGISRTRIEVEGDETTCFVPTLKDGAVVHESEKKVHVQAIGSLVIAVGSTRQGDYRQAPAVFSAICGYVKTRVIPALEPFVL